jgi:hypothetical protein
MHSTFQTPRTLPQQQGSHLLRLDLALDDVSLLLVLGDLHEQGLRLLRLGVQHRLQLRELHLQLRHLRVGVLELADADGEALPQTRQLLALLLHNNNDTTAADEAVRGDQRPSQ